MSKKDDRYILTKQEVDGVLKQDCLYRKYKSWPLIDVSTIQFSLQYASIHYPIISRTIVEELRKAVDVSAYIHTQYSVLKYLLYAFPLVVAGGALLKALYNINDPSAQTDIDLFFVGDMSQDEADKILRNIIVYFECNRKVIIEQSQNVTTIYDKIGKKGRNGDVRVYQFIHRIYPTKQQVIGGFDLGTSSILLDTEGIYTTPLGAFCLKFNINIMDYTRRSPSYEHRLLKYYIKYHTGILVLGTTVDHIKKLKDTLEHSYQNFHISKNITGYIDYNSKLSMPDYSNTYKKDISDAYTHDYEIDNPKAKVRNFTAMISNRFDCIFWRNTVYEKLSQSDIKYAIPETYIAKKATGDLFEDAPVLKRLLSGEKHTIMAFRNIFGTDDEFSTFIGVLMSEVQKQIIGLEPTTSSDLIARFQLRLQQKIDTTIATIKKTPVWIVKNPGRQWTSSFHPQRLPENQFYDPKIYVPNGIYIDEPTETTLRLMMKKKLGGWQHINNDTFNHIMKFLLLAC